MIHRGFSKAFWVVPGRSSGYRQVVVFMSFPDSAAKFMLNENVSVSVLGIVLNQRAFEIFFINNTGWFPIPMHNKNIFTI